jgi:hypothetical protein
MKKKTHLVARVVACLPIERVRVGVRLCASLAVVAVLTACGPIPPSPASAPRPTTGPGSAQTQPQPPDTQRPLPPVEREQPSRPPPKTFTLGPASLALVSQAHKQAQGGDYGEAATTIERALRIEPNNPLLWIEMGDIRLGEHNPAQADAMGRKALALATGDPQAQTAAWHLVSNALRAQGRNQEAAEADKKAVGATAR